MEQGRLQAPRRSDGGSGLAVVAPWAALCPLPGPRRARDL